MARTSDIQTFEEGRRKIRNDLIARGLDVNKAVWWCAAWEAEARRQGIPRGAQYWDDAWSWIDTQLAPSISYRPTAAEGRSPQ